MTISNDSEFKAALSALPIAQQRLVAARFVESVLSVSKDPRIGNALLAAQRADIGAAELAAAFHAARSASVESYTPCGKEADWLCQAGHFVAKAALNSVMPAAQGANLAWDAAMNARMARASETIARGEGNDNQEAERQYRILSEFLTVMANRLSG